MSVIRAILRSGHLKWCAPSSLIKIGLDLPAAACHCKCKSAISVSIPAIRQYSSSSDSRQKSDDADGQERELIYEGLLVPNIRKLKLFTLCTSSVGLLCQPFVYQIAMEAGTINSFTLPMFTIVGLFAIGTPLFIHAFTRRYVLSIEYLPKEDKYIAETFTLFVRRKKIEFTPADVTIPTVLGMFCTCAVKGKKLFIDSTRFTDQDHYVRIMGYDQPVDLNPGESNGNPEARKESN